MNTIVIALAGLFLLGTAVLWGAAVVYVLVDASRRKVARPVIWALGTLFTGPVGLIAYLMDRPKGVEATCGFCGKTVLATDKQCPYCCRQVG